MSCETWQAQLVTLLDHELGEPEATALRRHLDTCPGCQAAQRQLEALHGLLARDPDLEPSASLAPRVRARIRALAPAAPPTPGLLQRCWSWLTSRGLVPVLAPAALSAAAAVTLLLLQPEWTERSALHSEELMVAQELDLLEAYDVITQLDSLENLEVVEVLDQLAPGPGGTP